MADIQRGKIEEQMLYSDILGEDVTLLVYYPPNFSPLYKYTILIAQDGRDYFTLGRIARTADRLLDEQKIENTIIVGIPYRDVEDRRAKYHPKGEKHRAYLRFLANELVPYLDHAFPTYQMGGGRALIGDSLAGTVSLLAALSYPHTFGRVLLQSPYVTDDVLSAVESFEHTQLLEVYHVIGKNETAVETTNGKTKDFIRPNRKLNELFKAKGFTFFYDEFDGDHTWTYWQPDLERALAVMLKRY
ncbi:alpha/beta hydrolase [Bacillus marinisedimentorum]|uniref:alpha/beta hydrolase n=1 Tax=Bacillus marinisedimentorum TaxID=1821260 RepID=UPI0008727BCC|nr:esterase family protein [Bacillus marinisedimentorum]